MKIRTACLITVFAELFIQVSISKLVYNETKGYKGVYYSAAAYCAYETLTNWTCGSPCNQTGLTDIIQVINLDKHNFALAGYSQESNEIILTFRGTNGPDLDNWATNI